jgi:hypothetical protein
MGLSGGFSFSDLLALVGTLSTGIFFIVRSLLSIRDTLRDLKSTLGSVEPRSGLIGQIADIEEEVEKVQAQQQEQREWILQHDDRRREDRGLEKRRGLSIRKPGL